MKLERGRVLARKAVDSFFARYHACRRRLPWQLSHHPQSEVITPIFGPETTVGSLLGSGPRRRAYFTRLYLGSASDIPDGVIVRTQSGVEVRVYPDWMYASIYLFGEWEPRNTRLLELLVDSGDVVFDVGANFAWFSAILARRGSAVHAFEPVPSIALLAKETIALNGIDHQVALRELGLSSQAGQFTVYTFEGLPHGHASSCDLDRADANPHHCKVDTLDQYVAAHSVDRLDLIKVDVEGFELEVFQGGESTLSRPDAPLLFFEVNDTVLRKRRITGRAVQDCLRDYGYMRFWRVPARARVEEVHGSIPMAPCNYLAAKPQRAPRVMRALSRIAAANA